MTAEAPLLPVPLFPITGLAFLTGDRSTDSTPHHTQDVCLAWRLCIFGASPLPLFTTTSLEESALFSSSYMHVCAFYCSY